MNTKGLGRSQQHFISLLVREGGCVNRYRVEQWFACKSCPYLDKFLDRLIRRGILKQVWVYPLTDVSKLPAFVQDYVKAHPRARHFFYFTPEAYEYWMGLLG